MFSLGIRAAAVLAGFAVTFIIGRSMGAAATGQFALVTQTAILLAVVGLVGLDVSVVRHFAKTLAQNAPLSLRSLVQVSLVALGMMAAIGAGLWLAGDWLWDPFFGDVVPVHLLTVLCVLLAARGGTQLYGAILRSQHRFNLGQIVASLAIPAATLLAMATGLASTVEEALWAAAAGGFFALAIGIVAMVRRVSTSPDALQFSVRTVLASALPLWGVSIANNLGDWYGSAVAASMLGAAEAGLFRVAFQIAAVLPIISVALFAVYSSRISTANHSGDIRQVALLARSAVRLNTALAVPTALCVLAGSGFLLSQMGEEFTAALPLVYVMVISQLAITLTGPSGLVLAMSGHEMVNLTISIIGTVLLFLCVPVAASIAGLEGIAFCIGGIMALRNICAYFIVRQKLGISVWAGTARLAS